MVIEQHHRQIFACSQLGIARRLAAIVIRGAGRRSLRMIVPAGDETAVSSAPVALHQKEPRLLEVRGAAPLPETAAQVVEGAGTLTTGLPVSSSSFDVRSSRPASVWCTILRTSSAVVRELRSFRRAAI